MAVALRGLCAKDFGPVIRVGGLRASWISSICLMVLVSQLIIHSRGMSMLGTRKTESSTVLDAADVCPVALQALHHVSPATMCSTPARMQLPLTLSSTTKPSWQRWAASGMGMTSWTCTTQGTYVLWRLVSLRGSCCIYVQVAPQQYMLTRRCIPSCAL